MCPQALLPPSPSLRFRYWRTLRVTDGCAARVQEERPLQDDDSRERDLMYERAERVAASLAAMGDQLRDTILDVNASAEASLGDVDTPLGKAIRVLNNQLQALTAIDSRTDELQRRLRELQAGRPVGSGYDDYM